MLTLVIFIILVIVILVFVISLVFLSLSLITNMNTAFKICNRYIYMQDIMFFFFNNLLVYSLYVICHIL